MKENRKPLPKVVKQLGQRIKQVREEKGMTQEDLADSANKDRTTIGFLERGVRSPSVKTLDEIAKALNVPLYELFKF